MIPFPPAGSHNIVRVLSAVATPRAPYEVVELAHVDVVIDDAGVVVGDVSTRSFDLIGEESGVYGTCGRACTPMHIAESAWPGWSPDAFVSHDAPTAALVFPPSITRTVPWISTHKVARRLWPSAPSFQLESLVAWRANIEGKPLAYCDQPSGAVREAQLSAILLSWMLRDPGLRRAGEPVRRSDIERRHLLSSIFLDMYRADGLQAALWISAQPGPPLRLPPCAWDDQRDWAGVASEDLSYFVRTRPGTWVSGAARAELAKRTRVDAGRAPRWRPIFRRSTSVTDNPPFADNL